MRVQREPAELFHEVLERRWFLSERVGRDLGIDAAVTGYLRDVLVTKPDENHSGRDPLPPSS